MKDTSIWVASSSNGIDASIRTESSEALAKKQLTLHCIFIILEMFIGKTIRRIIEYDRL